MLILIETNRVKHWSGGDLVTDNQESNSNSIIGVYRY